MAKKNKDEAQYVRVQNSIWYKERFQKLSESAKLLYLYIVINPHGNMTGMFKLPPGYAIEDLCWKDEKRFGKGLQELLDVGLVLYDEKTKIIFNPSQLEKFPLQNPNQVKGAIAKLKELPKTPLLNELNIQLKRFNKPLYKPLQEWLQERLGEYVDVDVDVDVDVKEKNMLDPVHKKITYNLEENKWENLNGMIQVWKERFPAVDIQLELNKMASWLEANPKNRKSNYQKFIVNWLIRAQDKAPKTGSEPGVWK